MPSRCSTECQGINGSSSTVRRDIPHPKQVATATQRMSTTFYCDLKGNRIFTSACDIAWKGARELTVVPMGASWWQSHTTKTRICCSGRCCSGCSVPGSWRQSHATRPAFEWQASMSCALQQLGAKERFRVCCPCLGHCNGVQLCSRTAICDVGTEDSA